MPKTNRALWSFLAGIVPAAAWLPASLPGQCSSAWLPGMSRQGTDGRVIGSRLWDPDGSGPATPQLAIAGNFRVAGPEWARAIVSFDPATGAFARLGTGMSRAPGHPFPDSATVMSVAGLPNGDLVAVGTFEVAGGTTISGGVARWDGAAWQAMGANVLNSNAVLASASGAVYVAGTFAAGGTTVAGLAVWTGTSWAPIATGLDSPIESLAELATGEVVAGGSFTTLNGSSVPGLAKWDGTTWSPLGLSVVTAAHALLALPNGNLVVGGRTLAGLSHVVRYDGVTWTTLGGSCETIIPPILGGTPTYRAARFTALAATPNGDVVAAGDFTHIGGVPTNSVARWNGTSWAALNSRLSYSWPIQTLTAMPNGEVFAGGYFTTIDGTWTENAAFWNGSGWRPVADGIAGNIAAMTALRSGDLVVGGAFTHIANLAASSLARWNGSTWSDVGGGVAGVGGPGSIAAVIELPNGDLVVGGDFTSAGGVPATSVARWDGSAWHAMAGLSGSVMALAPAPNGDVLAAGTFLVGSSWGQSKLARWNGTTWTAEAVNGGSYRVNALAALPNGHAVASGSFTQIGTTAATNIARWDGTTWLAMGSGLPAEGRAMATLPDGDLVAVSSTAWPASTTLQRWNGSAWNAIAPGQISPAAIGGVSALCALPDGDLVVAGTFRSVGTTPANGVARWDGTSWGALGVGINDGLSLSGHGTARTLAFLPQGVLVVGGDFVTAGAHAAAGLAHYATTCPAQANSFGAGCTGSGGANRLAATSWPFVGASHQTVASGLPTLALVATVWGFQPQLPATPLAALHASGQPGCLLLVSADFIALQLAAGGVASTSQQVPNIGNLVGFTYRQQALVGELDAAGTIVASTSTNALVFTIGQF